MRTPELDADLPPVTIYCDPNLDRILYATWLLIAALVGAAAFVVWRIAK